jgi:YihY family inner membrane protein
VVNESISVLLGGLFAAILLAIAKKGFAFYIKQIHSYEAIYDAFTSIPIIYISWLITLYGALVIQAKYGKSLNDILSRRIDNVYSSNRDAQR